MLDFVVRISISIRIRITRFVMTRKRHLFQHGPDSLAAEYENSLFTVLRALHNFSYLSVCLLNAN